ncbi:metallophosphoesterase, partial [Mammaliicoccus sciuri]
MRFLFIGDLVGKLVLEQLDTYLSKIKAS